MRKSIRIVFGLIASIAIVSCATTPKEAFYINDNFKPANKQKIYLLPTVNMGVDKSLDTDLDRSSLIKATVKKRGYQYLDGTHNISDSQVNPGMLDTLEFGWVEQLPLEKGAWVLIPVVDYLNRFGYQLGMRADAYVTGYLIDSSTGDLLWEGFGYGTEAAGVLLAALVDDDALTFAMNDLMQSLPVRESSLRKSQYHIEPNIHCATDCSDSEDNATAQICVLRDKNTSMQSEHKSRGGKFSNRKVKIMSLYDGANVIGELPAGEYRCWRKRPGRTFIHFGIADKPLYFRAAAGSTYYWHADYKWRKGWLYDSISQNNIDHILASYSEATNNN